MSLWVLAGEWGYLAPEAVHGQSRGRGRSCLSIPDSVNAWRKKRLTHVVLFLIYCLWGCKWNWLEKTIEKELKFYFDYELFRDWRKCTEVKLCGWKFHLLIKQTSVLFAFFVWSHPLCSILSEKSQFWNMCKTGFYSICLGDRRFICLDAC